MATEEDAEHARHAAHAGNKRIAMLIAVMAALLALSETGAKMALTEAGQESIAANDLWNFYQAKTIRMTTLAAEADLAETLDPPADPGKADARAKAVQKWRADARRYDSDPTTHEGRKELAERAAEAERSRDLFLVKLHGFEEAAAAFQLGIVLSTAAVITGAVWFVIAALGLGVVGSVLAVLSWMWPHLIAAIA